MALEYPHALALRDPCSDEEERFTIRPDTELLEWFKQQGHGAGGGNYQALINSILREYVEGEKEQLEATLRRLIREEFKRAS